MSLAQAVVLGIVQGLTEFLPVSSSGHLVLGEALLGLRLPGVFFEVVLHVATLCAVLWVYRARVGRLVSGVLRGEGESWRYLLLLALASIPAGLAGTLGQDFFEGMFGRPTAAAAFLLVTGVLVWSVRRTGGSGTADVPGAGQALWIGIAQAVAIFPGISRSGATVAAGAWRGVRVVPLAEFSFLLSVPAIAGAAILQLGDVGSVAAAGGLGPAAAGFAAALGSGIFAIRLFVRMLERRSFHRFGVYCWIAGSAYLLASLLVPSLR
ncbi:MAG: undecaprenyl-diphosphate phosphatase [Gemmatimonadota bacterium]